MLPKMVVLLFLVFYGSVAMASDADPVFDFCLPSRTSAGSSTYPCRNSTQARVEDFIFSGIRLRGKFNGSGFSSIAVNSNVFPGLNNLGMSMVRADFDIGGVNVPHYHPRATEVAVVLDGRIYSGFINTNNQIFAKVIEKGEVMVFPRGLIHFQMNVGRTPATILGSFNSQNPGLMKIPSAIFGSGIRDDLLEKAFGLSSEELTRLKRRLAPHKSRPKLEV